MNGQELNEAMAPRQMASDRDHSAKRGVWRALTRVVASRGVIRQLGKREQKAYLRHLKRLDGASVRQRFNRPMSEAGLTDHVARTFETPGTVVLGWFRHGVLRGAAEIAVFRPDENGPAISEGAFTVESRYRRRGVGRKLLARAALIARNRRARTLLVSTTWDNRAMLGLASSFGVRFTRGETDAEGRLATGRRTVYSVCLETMREEIGLIGWFWDRLTRRAALILRRRTAAHS